MTVLSVMIVEDDEPIAELIVKNLTAAGFQCHHLARGDEVQKAIARVNPALLILDIQLPGVNGLELTRRIRQRSNLPILLLTARSSDVDKVLGFEIGADDYVTKPFSTEELVARARALLRRAHIVPQQKAIQCGDLLIDPTRRVISRDGEAISVTSLEFDLIHFMANQPGRVFSRDALLDQVWSEGRIIDDRTIDSLISRLRRKLETNPAKPRYIQTVWGAGYRFAENLCS